MTKTIKILIIISLSLFCRLAFTQTVGNVIRDVPGHSVAKFVCANNEILKFDTTLDPPMFKCAADDAGAASGYDTIKEEGSALTQRTTLKFIGALITCADSGGETVCTLVGDGTGQNALLDGTNHTDTTNSAVTRGDIIVGNSTPAWDDLAIGSSGTILTSNGTDPAWKSPVLQTPCDESTETCFFDDFNSYNDDTTAGTVTAANIGEWHSASSGTNATARTIRGGITVAGSGSGLPSASLGLVTGTSTGGEACVWRAGNATYGARNAINSSTRGKSAIRFAFHTDANLSSVGDRYIFEIGSNSGVSCNITATSSGANAASIYYSDNENSGKFEGIFLSAVTGITTCNTNVTAVADTTYKGCIVMSADGETIDYYITSTLSALDCRDVNNIVGSPQCTLTLTAGDGGSLQYQPFITLNKTAGTNSRTWWVDYYGFYQKTDAAR